MRAILLCSLAVLIVAGESTPGDRIIAGFAAWAAPGGDGTAACVAWLDGAAPAAGAGKAALIRLLDGIPAAERQQRFSYSDPLRVKTGDIEADLYFVPMPTAGNPVIGFAFQDIGGKPTLVAIRSDATRAGARLTQEKVKHQLLTAIATVSSAAADAPAQGPADPLGPYAFTVPGSPSLAKLVVWGTPLALPMEIELGTRASTVTLRFQPGDANQLKVVIAPVHGAEIVRELALAGGMPTAERRSSRLQGAGSGAEGADFAPGRAALPAAWLGRIDISYVDTAGASQRLSITLE